MAVYGTLMTVAIVVLPMGTWWKVALLVPGSVAVKVIGSRLYASAQYVLTSESITRTSRGRAESIALADLTRVSGYFRAKLGDLVSIQGGGKAFDLQLGAPDVTLLLERLGPLLVDLGIDRRVVADEKTRRWLGLSGGGLRDPWTSTP